MGRGVVFGLRMILIIFSVSSACIVFGSNLTKSQLSHRSLSGFIENKGQIIDQNNKPNPAVRYLLNIPGFNVQLRNGGFSYDVYSVTKSLRKDWTSQFPDKLSGKLNPASDRLHEADSMQTDYQFHRIDLDLPGADPNCEIIAADPSKDYTNYYTTGTPLGGVCNVRSYQKVTYKNIYPGIDLEFLQDSQNRFKYNFIVSPGGNLNAIRLHISGAETALLFSGSVVLKSKFGDITEEIPKSYTLTDGREKEIQIKFCKLTDEIYGFLASSTTPDHSSVIIDPLPNRLWATYYGGLDYDVGNDCKVDPNGFVYLTGETSSTHNIATSGAFQINFAGSSDAFLSKFDQDGQRQWGTYYGGSSSDRGSVLSIDKTGMVFLEGLTRSNNNIATPGAFQESYAGGSYGDCMLCKFNPDGQRIWCTYYGGSNSETEGGCSVDNHGFVYLSGTTYSTNNISTPGSFKPALGGLNDGFLAKLDTSGHNRSWGTYYGGTSADDINSCSADTLGHILIAGGTESPNGIASPGAYQTTPGGGGYPDGFLSLFDSSGQRQWGTYYGGSLDDRLNACSLNNIGTIYAAGQTSSSDNIASPGAYQTIFGGINDGFLVKFNLSGQRQWGTYFGADSSDLAIGCAVNDSCYVYISGYTRSRNNIATPGSFQPVYGGGTEDAFLAKFDSTGNLKWSTYYGGSERDEGQNCAVDTTGHIYLAGSTSSANNMATPGACQTDYGGGSWDAFLVKMADCTLPDTANQLTGPNNVCLPSDGITYSIPPIAHALSYIWHVPYRVVIVSGTGTNAITVNFTSLAISGIISVYGRNSCGNGDSAFISVTVHHRPLPVITGQANACTGTSYQYSTATGKSNYQWTVSPGGTIISGGSSNDPTSTVIWNSVGSQWIQVNYKDTNNCPALTPGILNVSVTQGDSVNISISASANPVCQGSSVTFTATAINPGSSPIYQWEVNGVNQGTNSTTYTYTPLNNDAVSCVLTSSLTTCVTNNPATSNTITMTVNPPVVVSVSIAASANPVCQGTFVTFTATAVNPGSNPFYQWKINGANAGGNSSTYSYIPLNNDAVSCVLTSSLTTCVTNNPATSNTITMTVNPLSVVSVSIAASANPVCQWTTVTFTATAVNPGSSPVYQWKVNAVIVGGNSSTFTYTPLNNDAVSCVLTSSLTTCVTNNPATSNTVSMGVNPLMPVSVSITASANPVCAGLPVTFSASPVNGGSSPAYQW